MESEGAPAMGLGGAIKKLGAALAQVQGCRRVLFEAGRMAPMLYHGLSRLGLPVVCVESRQAYQALKSLATPRPTATMHTAWRIWHAPASSNPFM